MTKLLSSAGNAKAHVYLNHHRLRFIRNLSKTTMSSADGRSSPRSPIIPQASILTSFFDILIPLKGKLVVQKSRYVRDYLSLLYDE